LELVDIVEGVASVGVEARLYLLAGLRTERPFVSVALDLRRFRGLFQTEINARKGAQCHERIRPTHRSFAEKLSGRLGPPTRSIPGIVRKIGVSDDTLSVGDEVEVIGMAPVEECEHDMFVEMDRDDEDLAIPLSQLEVVDADDETRGAVEDWIYWTKKGYQF
jgi:hypothetical protein